MNQYILKPTTPHATKLPESFYEELNENQKKAVLHQEGPVLVIAGAGSGKTKTLVHRVARLVSEGIPPESILLLTFTRKASQEMLKRATQILDHRCHNVAGGTFHAFSNIILRKYAERVGYSPNFTILDQADSEDMVAGIRKSQLTTVDKRFPKKRTITSIISKSINTNKTVEEILETDYPHYYEFSQDIEQIWRGYQDQKQALSVMDYDDLLIILNKLLVENEDIRTELSSAFKFIMVDEYQDTNKLQANIVKNLASTHNNVMVVGDDSQSIYSFRGAHFKNIIDFPKLFEGTEIITLDQNYRSTQPILDITNQVIKGAEEKYAKSLFTEKKGSTKPAFIETGSENEQSSFICQKILELREEGVALSDIAVLFRSSQHANDLEVELTSHNIPYTKYGGFKFTETAHIKDVVAFLRVLFNMTDGISWNRLLMLLEGVGPKMASTLFEFIKLYKATPQTLSANQWKEKKFGPDLARIFKFIATAQEKSPHDALEQAIEVYTPIMQLIYDDHHKRKSDIDSLLDISQRFDSLETFLSEISLEPPDASQSGAEAESQDDEKLIISTIHSSKGLEWHTVFILSLVDGYIPSFRSLNDPTQLEEERRLLYVAMTRARENLFLLKPQIETTGENYYRYQGFSFSNLTRFLDQGSLMDTFTDKWSLIPAKPKPAPNPKRNWFDQKYGSSASTNTTYDSDFDADPLDDRTRNSGRKYSL